MEYIYGLDLSMACTGISIFDTNGNPIKTCSIATKDKNNHGERLKIIADFMLDLKSQYPPKKIIMERAFSQFNTATAVIYRVHGLVNYLFWDVPQIYYTPKTIKAGILSGKATKKQIREKIESCYPEMEFNNEDESDSFSVIWYYFINENIIKV